MVERAEYIRQWKVAYYRGDPLVDDQTFDLHWRNLLWLESRYPHLAAPDSPTQGVGAPPSTRNRKTPT
jgi:DNA ligase (NAD+)